MMQSTRVQVVAAFLRTVATAQQKRCWRRVFFQPIRISSATRKRRVRHTMIQVTACVNSRGDAPGVRHRTTRTVEQLHEFKRRRGQNSRVAPKAPPAVPTDRVNGSFVNTAENWRTCLPHERCRRRRGDALKSAATACRDDASRHDDMRRRSSAELGAPTRPYSSTAGGNESIQRARHRAMQCYVGRPRPREDRVKKRVKSASSPNITIISVRLLPKCR